jgi:hypothetical protein
MIEFTQFYGHSPIAGLLIFLGIFILIEIILWGATYTPKKAER